MTTILIIEANPPDVLEFTRANGVKTTADCYELALKGIKPDLLTRVAEPYREPLSRADLEGIDGVAFTGSDVVWLPSAPEAAALRLAGEMVLGSGLPVIGSCNGLQLATVLLGGIVKASSKGMEIGLACDITMTQHGRSHAMMRGRKDHFCAPCMHRDEVYRLPDEADLVSSNEHSEVQAMTYQKNGVDFWGMQYHPEFSPSTIADYVCEPDGFFSEARQLAPDLRLADTNEEAALRLGGRQNDLSGSTRTTELANWLSHIHDRNTSSAAGN